MAVIFCCDPTQTAGRFSCTVLMMVLDSRWGAKQEMGGGSEGCQFYAHRLVGVSFTRDLLLILVAGCWRHQD